MIELLRGLKDIEGIATFLATLSDRIEYPEIFDLGIPIFVFERRSKYDPAGIAKLFSLCKDIRPDIIHSWGTIASLYSIPTTKWHRIKLINGNITNAPNNLGLFDKRYILTRLSYWFADKIVANSRAGLQMYRVPKDKASLIYNGFDFDRLRSLKNATQMRLALGIRSDFVVAMVGTFDSRKDFGTYVKAAIELLESGHDISFLAIGDGAQRIELEQQIPAQYQEQIIFTGQLDNVEEAMSLINIGVLCTNTNIHGEGISNVVMEYMSLGKPVIATGSGGTAEIIQDGITGYLIPSGSVKALVEKIQWLVHNPKKGQEMGTSGRLRIVQHFSIGRMIENYLHLYEEVLDNSTTISSTPNSLIPSPKTGKNLF